MNLVIFQNLDLLSVGIAIAAIGILGFVVFFNDRKSSTNKAFLVFSIITIFWSAFNYLQYQVNSVSLSFWLTRLVIFIGVWHSFALFRLFYVFPHGNVAIPRWQKFFLIPITAVVAILTLTPAVFRRVSEIASDGRIAQIENGPGIAVFGILVFGLIVSAVFLLIRKVVRSDKQERRPYKLVLSGTVATFILLMVFNFVLPAFFDDPKYIPLGAIFILPFVLFTAYAIFKHHLLNIKVITTEIVAFLLILVAFLEVIFADDIGLRVFRSGVFVLVFGFSVLLIKSVIKEVKQRELLEELNAELEEQKAQVEELSNFKTQLLSFASHQLKAPMAVIKGYASILLEGLYGPVKGKVRDTVVKMRESTDELISLINTLLDLRRIDEGRMEYQFTEVKLGELTAHVIDGLAPLAEKKKLKLTFKKPDHPVRVHADGPKLAQVIGNLVENAIKYTERGSVEVTMTDDQKLIKDTSGNDVMVTVKDTGLGISETLLPNLFQEFSRDERVKKEIRGTGLGLYIAKKMLEAHEGVIWAESAGEGKGSTFFVKLKKL